MSTTPINERLQLLGKQMRSDFIQRDDEVEITLLALVAMVHVFLLGSPGVGKSMLLERLCGYIDGMRLFRKLLTPTTTPPELWGPYDVAGLKDGHFRLVTRGKLPSCSVAVVEETFKATSQVLNGLLMAMNERVYEDDGAEVKMPLATMFGASNELPDDPFLLAFFDRFLFRRQVPELLDAQSRRDLLDLDLSAPTPLVSWAEVEQAQQAARLVTIDADTKDAIIEIDQRLRDLGIQLTGRRLRELLKVVRAAAWLEGEDTATRIHLEALVHICWERPEQAKDVQKAVLEVSSPHQQKALELSDAVADQVEELDRILGTDAGNDRTTQLMDLFARMELNWKEAEAMLPTVAGRGRRLVEESRERLAVHGSRLFKAQGLSSKPFAA